MAEETHLSEPAKGPNKRRVGHKKGSKGKTKQKKMEAGNFKPKKVDKKMKKLFRKRSREYNSDDENEDEDEHHSKNEDDEVMGGYSSEEAGEDGDQDRQGFNADYRDSEDEEDDTVQPGIMKFNEGCRAFRLAFKSITKKGAQDDALVSLLLHDAV